MKLFVGNLPYTVNDASLKELFAPFGEVQEATVIKDKFSGRSKGFGFVTFAQDADAQKAMSALNGTDVQGRQMTVNEAKPMSEDRGERRSSFNNRRRF